MVSQTMSENDTKRVINDVGLAMRYCSYVQGILMGGYHSFSQTARSFRLAPIYNGLQSLATGEVLDAIDRLELMHNSHLRSRPYYLAHIPEIQVVLTHSQKKLDELERSSRTLGLSQSPALAKITSVAFQKLMWAQNALTDAFDVVMDDGSWR